MCLGQGMELGLVHVRFPKIHICSENNKFKIFLRVPRIMLDVCRVILCLDEDYLKIICSFQL
jgi:hypothetical protein